MKKIIYKTDAEIEKEFAYQAGQSDAVWGAVEEILKTVRNAGDQALYKYTKEFDGADLSTLLVSEGEIEEAFQEVPESLQVVLNKAKKNIEEYHRHQLREDFFFTRESGVMIGQKITPIAKVGLYVPGGTAAYPSTVLMDAIPAKIAGVEELVMVTPPGKDGKVNPVVLVAARIAGVDKILKIGGAQAVAALAYGTETVPKVDKIVGPGNIYVATAKRMVFGQVSIDMVAGPSEVLIVADKEANPVYVAADLLSQAEHDKLASSILVTPDEALADAVILEVEKQCKKLSRREIAEESIANNGRVILVDNLDVAVHVSDIIAPEHLELAVSDPFALLGKVKNAGSIFMGHYTPEPLGDYMAGPNHTLPTSGTARFSSPLGVDDFIKKSSFSYYTKDALFELKDDLIEFANSEGLTAHGKSVEVRFKGEKA